MEALDDPYYTICNCVVVINYLVYVLFVCIVIYVTVYGKTGHNAACVNIEKRSIDFLKMYCFKPTEGNG